MIKPQKRISKKTGEVSYLLRVNLGFVNGEQIIKSMTYKPDKDMTPKQINNEVIRQQVLFEERAKQEYQEQLEYEAKLQLLEAEQQEKQDNYIEYANLLRYW